MRDYRQHKRLLRLVSDIIVKKFFSFIFKNTSFKNLGARLGILRRRAK